MGNASSVSPLFCSTLSDPYVELVSLLDRAQRASISMSSYVAWCVKQAETNTGDVFVFSYNNLLKNITTADLGCLKLIVTAYCAYFDRPLAGFTSVDYEAVLRDVDRGYVEPMWQCFLRDCSSGDMVIRLKNRRAQDVRGEVVERLL
jgi:hypothetical protein